MRSKMPKLKEKIDQLPPKLKNEVDDFIDFLIDKYKKDKSTTLKQDWSGALKEYKNKYTSMQLQEKAKEWRKK